MYEIFGFAVLINIEIFHNNIPLFLNEIYGSNSLGVPN
tara:strand:+ start:616 stop:729 length:114 start_codon:yes stop_codon:yes gene_type:complete